MMDPSSSTSAAQFPQRRVQPSRLRRGGPGVGNCETDQMILETNRRKPENEPVIPEHTRFFLTTNPAFAPPELESVPLELVNIHANDRYFDRPELLKAIRQQQEIETPQYEKVSEADIVGGRFRPRATEDGIVDTSDAAYERRHKRYETFEKRVRLREKEKLKHEQYKLQERVEQLRAMEHSAFLALPASAFSPAPVRFENDGNLNGAAAVQEAERRREEMLEGASVLQDRYKMLLPPDRARRVNGSTTGTPVLPQLSPPPESSEPPQKLKIISKPPRKYTEEVEDSDATTEELEYENGVRPSTPQPKLFIKIRGKSASAVQTPHSTPPASSPAKQHKKKIKMHMEPPYPADAPMLESDMAVLEQPPAKKRKRISKKQRLLEENGQPQLSGVRIISKKSAAPSRHNLQNEPLTQTTDDAARGASMPPIAVLDDAGGSNSRANMADGLIFPTSPDVSTTHLAEGSISVPVPRRKSRHPKVNTNATMTDALDEVPRAVSAAPRVRAAPNRPPTKCTLVTAAQRASEQAVARKGRNLTAFGYKVPSEVDMELQYELPLWILQDDEFQKRYSKYPNAKETLNPNLVIQPKYDPDPAVQYAFSLAEAYNAVQDREASISSVTTSEDETDEEVAGPHDGRVSKEEDKQDGTRIIQSETKRQDEPDPQEDGGGGLEEEQEEMHDEGYDADTQDEADPASAKREGGELKTSHKQEDDDAMVIDIEELDDT